MTRKHTPGDTPTAAGSRALNSRTGVLWHKSAPAAVRKKSAAGELDAAWLAWQEHLATRKHPVDVVGLMPGESRAMGWALPASLATPPQPDWLAQAVTASAPDVALEKSLLEWLAEAAGNSASVQHAHELLVCSQAMPSLGQVLSAEVWWTLLDHLLATIHETETLDLTSAFCNGEPLAHQLVAGELALTLAYLLPEVAACHELKSTATKALSRGVADLLDGEGLPHARNFGLVRPLLACWTRCLLIGDAMDAKVLTRTARQQYEWLVRQAFRLTRPDGTQVFSEDATATLPSLFIETALDLGGDEGDYAIAEQLFSTNKKAKGKSSKAKHGLADLPEAAINAEWAAAAVLRRDWSRTGQRLTVAYPDQVVMMELSCGRDVVFSGPWQLELSLDGELVPPETEWEQVCWVSDEDVDYLELEMSFVGGLRVQRQMVLAHEDRFLLLADAVLGSRSGKLEYRSGLPLWPGVDFTGDEQSREGVLVGSKRRGLVMPLALPEWRADISSGELALRDGVLQLRQSHEGHHLYAPLFIDLDRHRFSKRLTWRQLTVAEQLQIVSPEVAAGYRVAVGNEQWLIYRSLAHKANRTLLGHNLATEALIARFDKAGEIEPLMEVE